MKALFFYNPYSGPDMALKAEIEADGQHIISVDAFGPVAESFRALGLIRATPAIVEFKDHMQGEFLTRDGVDAATYIRARLAEAQEEEEKAVHDMTANRLDNMVNGEKAKAATAAVDEYTIELMKEGVL